MSKTPNKIPNLVCSSSKKKTPCGDNGTTGSSGITRTNNSGYEITNDRFIPNRSACDMENSYHLMVGGSENSENENLVDDVKRRLLNAENGTKSGANGLDRAKVLHLHSKPPEPDHIDNMKVLYNGSTGSVMGSCKKNTTRHIPSNAEKVLDAPDFKDDYYLNLIDWSTSNYLAVALNRDVYIWNAAQGAIQNLFSMPQDSPDSVSSLSWIERGNVLAVANTKNQIQLWDTQKQKCVRQMSSHTSRIGSLSWNAHLLSSGSKTGEIHHYDVRVANFHVASLKHHTQEVCGLKWSSDGRHLASGSNDNLVCVWDAQQSLEVKPIHVLRDHMAAVKAVAWCPWQSNLLATGGGTNDRHIKIWNIHNGNLLQSIDAQSQISAILWSSNYRELISSHGYTQNQLTIWKYPEMSKVCDLLGHEERVLGMCMSPDEEMVVSVSSDETLRFWRCFACDEKTKRKRELSEKEEAKTKSGLINRCIR